ncbi:MAG: thiamine pyrophosphate-dependent enzyme [Thermodesulfobacteriota bacterium]
MKFQLPETDLIYSGHPACPGCGAALALRFALKALGTKVMLVMPACCAVVITGPYPTTCMKVPVFHTAFATAAAVASGLKHGLEAKGDYETTVVGWAGDGGTYDIGFQALSGAVDRNEDFIYVCYDNEGYMNTGIQKSSATPWKAWTGTTPYGKDMPKKDMMEILAAHRIPYAANASVGFPDDLIRKIKKAMSIRGSKFIHILAPCPPGWKSSDHLTVKLARLAVDTKIFPLYEVEAGWNYTINRVPKGLPVEEYLKLQGRYSHLSEQEMRDIQQQVDWEWELLLKKAGMNSG